MSRSCQQIVAEKRGLAADRRFRGSIALCAYGQDDAFAMEKLVIRAVPWAERYSHMVSPSDLLQSPAVQEGHRGRCQLLLAVDRRDRFVRGPIQDLAGAGLALCGGATAADSGADMLEFMRHSDFDFTHKAVIGLSGRSLGLLVPAQEMRLTVIRGGLHVAGRSDGMSLLVLPQQFPHCLSRVIPM